MATYKCVEKNFKKIILVNNLTLLYYLLHNFILFLVIQLTMDDVSSETYFVSIKKFKKNELQKHLVVHQSEIKSPLQHLNHKYGNNWPTENSFQAKQVGWPPLTTWKYAPQSGDVGFVETDYYLSSGGGEGVRGKG